MQTFPGRDFVTLFTCTPVGVNSHRLLVRGERIDAPPAMAGSMQGDVHAGFPWWLLAFVGGVCVAGVLSFRSKPAAAAGVARP